jgi:hypothetical protein
MRRALLVLFALVLTLEQSYAAIAPVANVNAQTSGGGNVTTSAINNTGATAFVACVGSLQGGTNTIFDSSSNTWTALTQLSNPDPTVQLFYVLNPTVSSSQTFSLTNGSGNTSGIYVYSFSGTGTFDQTSPSGGTKGAFVGSFQPGAFTPTVNGELIWTCNTTNNSFTYTINSGFSSPAQTANTNSGFSYLVQATSASINPTWTWGTSATYAMSMAAIKPSASVAPQVPPFVIARWLPERMLARFPWFKTYAWLFG